MRVDEETVRDVIARQLRGEEEGGPLFTLELIEHSAFGMTFFDICCYARSAHWHNIAQGHAFHHAAPRPYGDVWYTKNTSLY